ncbi:ABC transporter substrate-binding protein [Streptomyces sp. SID3343]|uniref:ABC transporter substrate-binding protein n=1 Tax=Streptomyces sp. SID3343 TaxID=2690260 RepID=UPI0013693875|nr:ABC transporter substrate-binding protein [Streptomyces sp. SID3343]MYW01291.1 ABC transporter substrate-binding protein [Streptomyces sp. SID3343]
MASTSAGRHGMRRRVAAGVLALPLIMAVGCSRSGDDAIAKGSGEAVNPQQPNNSVPTPGGGGGDFGTLKGVCGKGDGQALTKKGKGVSDTEIKVSVMGDPQNTFQPGLGQEFFDMADGFTKWCNELGGINGRKIALTKRDGGLFDVGKAMTDACQTDFMVVGGGNPFDAAGVKPRVDCKLGAFPAYVVSEASAQAALQDLAVGLPTTTTVTGAYKAIFDKYPDVKDHVGLLGQSVPDLIPVMQRYQKGVEAAGGKIVYKEDVAATAPPGRTSIEKMKADGVQMLVTTWLAVNSTSMFQEMDAIGWHPKVMISDTSGYNRYTLDTAKKTQMPETYIYPTFVPQSLADKNPVAKQALDILHKAKPKNDLEFFHMSGLNSWLLFATAVKECGTDLSTECVLAKGKRPMWDAGGLFAPGPITDAANMRANDCFTVVKVTNKGFIYDEGLARPNKGIFNCDPKNVAEVAAGAPPAQTPPADTPSTDVPSTETPSTETPADPSTDTPPADTSGSTAGTTDGSTAGTTDGSTAGTTDGSTDGSVAGTTDGSVAGTTDGSTAGTTDGSTDGSTAGTTDGSTTGDSTGDSTGSTI